MTAIPAVKAYLVDTLLPSLVPTGTSIVYGYMPPRTYEADDLVCVTDAQAAVTIPNMGTPRGMEEDGTVFVLIQSYRAGTDTAQREATEAAFVIHDALRNHFKTSATENLGGIVRTIWVTNVELTEDGEEVDPEDLAAGRLSILRVTMSFKARN